MLSTQFIWIKTSSEMRNIVGKQKVGNSMSAYDKVEPGLRLHRADVMRKNCTFCFWWNPLTAVFRFVSFSLSRRNTISSPLDVSEWSAHAWLSSKNDVKLETTHKKTTPTGKGAIFYGRSLHAGFAVNEQNIECGALRSTYCPRMVFFLVKSVEFDINHGFDSVPETMAKHWMSVGYCPPIAHSPFAYPLQWNRTTAHCPPCARPMECHQWPRPERDSASATHPDRRIMLILSCEVLHYFFGIVSVAILLDYVTHCLRDEHFFPVLLWIVMKLI